VAPKIEIDQLKVDVQVATLFDPSAGEGSTKTFYVKSIPTMQRQNLEELEVE